MANNSLINFVLLATLENPVLYLAISYTQTFCVPKCEQSVLLTQCQSFCRDRQIVLCCLKQLRETITDVLDKLLTFIYFFYVLLTVHLSIILVINQRIAQNLVL